MDSGLLINVCSQGELNLHPQFRKLVLCPLSYGSEVNRILLYLPFDRLPYVWQNIFVEFVKTTLRINKALKKDVERLAREKNDTFQSVLNDALYMYVNQKSKERAKEIVFRSKHLGASLDNLTRDDYYDDPR